MARSIMRTRATLTAACVVTAASLLSSCSGPQATAGTAKTATVKVPSSALIKAGQVTYCSDISSPPLTFYNASQKAVGAEIELGDALAGEMGVQPNWANTNFNGIIPALQAKQCDAIISQLYIKPEREKVVDFVPYMYASNTLVVAADNHNINSLSDLCGKVAAGETGTTVVDFLQQQSSKCEAAGKPKIEIRQFTKDSDALQQLKLGLVNAYGTTLETAGYVMKKQPGTFRMAGKPFNSIKVGIATRKDDTALHKAFASALKHVQKSGKYDAILKKWNLSGDSISAQ